MRDVFLKIVVRTQTLTSISFQKTCHHICIFKRNYPVVYNLKNGLG